METWRKCSFWSWDRPGCLRVWLFIGERRNFDQISFFYSEDVAQFLTTYLFSPGFELFEYSSWINYKDFSIDTKVAQFLRVLETIKTNCSQWWDGSRHTRLNLCCFIFEFKGVCSCTFCFTTPQYKSAHYI